MVGTHAPHTGMPPPHTGMPPTLACPHTGNVLSGPLVYYMCAPLTVGTHAPATAPPPRSPRPRRYGTAPLSIARSINKTSKNARPPVMKYSLNYSSSDGVPDCRSTLTASGILVDTSVLSYINTQLVLEQS